MSLDTLPDEAQEFLTALVDLLGRTGMSAFQLRYSDDDEPTVWMAVATYPTPDAIPVVGGAGKSLRTRYLSETAAALDPVVAVYRLAQLLIDGGRCVHCERTTVLWGSYEQPPSEPRLAEFCYHIFNPTTASFDLGCRL